MNPRIFVLIVAVLALVGLGINVAVDRDNVYDMTTTTLFLLTFIFAIPAARAGKSKAAA